MPFAIKTFSRAVCLTTVLIAVAFTSCGTEDWHPDPSQLKNSQLTIKAFWGSEEGYSATREGVLAAEQTDEFKAVEKYVEVDLQKDASTPQEAARLAREISLKPNILAVVGHARSGTTRAALPFYATAGIPVLMPTATSPYVLYRFDDDETWPNIESLRKGSSNQRFDNAFRLPPSDVPDQAHAIALTLKELSGPNSPKPRVMLICDTTSRSGSDVYTKPMCDSLIDDPEVSRWIASYRAFTPESGDIYALVTEIHAVGPDYIILLGYPELARDVLEELRERSQGQEKLPYKFIMPDACLANYLIKFSQDIYVTSPFSAERALSCGSRLAKDLTDHLSTAKPKDEAATDEAYAFDAIKLLADAVSSCKDHQVDRACVMQYFKVNHEKLEGACEEYHIDGGERQNATYNVNSVCSGVFKVRWFARKDGQKLEENPGWCN